MMRIRDLGRFSGPTVLMLHDSPVPAPHLEQLAHALAQSSRVIVPDLPGYADSPLTARTIGGTQLQLQALLSGLELEMVDMVGVGLGGYRALCLALDGRIKVRRIVCLNAFATLNGEERRRCSTHADVLSCGGDLTEMYVERALPPERRDASSELARRLRAWILEVSRDTLIAELESQARCEDLTIRLPRLKAGLLALHGERDQLVPVEHSVEMTDRAPYSVLEKLPCGHLPLDELPDRVIPRVRAFLSF